MARTSAKMHMHVHYLCNSCMPDQYPHPFNIDTDELWDPKALIWIREGARTHLSYCLKNGRLVPITSFLLSPQHTEDELTTSSNVKICCWVIWHDLWPPAIKIPVQILSPLLSPESSPRSSPESKVQVLYCPKLVQQPLSHRSASTLWEDSWAKLASQLHKWTLLIWIQIRFKNKPV